MDSFDFRGLQVKYVRQGKGEPMVLIHNGGSSHIIWKEVLPLLAERFEVFALDLPGFGASSSPDQRYTLTDFTEMLSAFVDAHCATPVRLVGNCMGSAISLGLAMRRPRDIAAVVLINPLTLATFADGKLGSTLWLRRQLPGLSLALHRAVKHTVLPKPLARQALAFQIGAVGRGRQLQLTPELRACFARDAQLQSLLGVFNDLNHYAVFDSLQPDAGFPPLCTIWGEQNRVLSARAGQRLNQTLKPAREVWLPDCGHLPMLERADDVAAIIGEFFAAAKQKAPIRSPLIFAQQ